MAIVMPNDMAMDDLIAAMKRLLKINARMYMHMVKETVTRFGRDGEMSIRYGVRAYGHWRGSEMRQAHHALGLEINMRNLIGCWDNASTYLAKDTMEVNSSYKPHDTRFDVMYCPAAEAWKDAEFFQWGHVYCDEFHQACASTYHPDGNVVIPQNLMKGDDHCHFQWVMPPDAAELDLGEPTPLGRKLALDYQASTDLETAWRSLKRSNRLVGGRFYTHASVILERHGEEGREALMDALANWGAERGRMLRKEHEQAGIPVSLENFIRHHDMPASFVWRYNTVFEDRKLAINIEETPHDEVWEDLDALAMGDLWYSNAYPAMAKAYMPEAKTTLINLKARGDTANRFEFTL